MSTVDFSCSYISSSTPCTIHDKVANTDDVVWVGVGGFKGETSYLLTCFVSYCYFKCSFFFLLTHTEIFTKAKVVYG